MYTDKAYRRVKCGQKIYCLWKRNGTKMVKCLSLSAEENHLKRKPT